MIQTLVHTCRGLGCSIFIETYVKRQSNPLPFKVCSIQQYTEHIQPSTVISKNDSKKCVHFGTTARVIRVNAVKRIVHGFPPPGGHRVHVEQEQALARGFHPPDALPEVQPRGESMLTSSM